MMKRGKIQMCIENISLTMHETTTTISHFIVCEKLFRVTLFRFIFLTLLQQGRHALMRCISENVYNYLEHYQHRKMFLQPYISENCDHVTKVHCLDIFIDYCNKKSR